MVLQVLYYFIESNDLVALTAGGVTTPRIRAEPERRAGPQLSHSIRGETEA